MEPCQYDRETLLAFVTGSLNEAETEQILAHLAESEACLAVVDELWSEHFASVSDVDNQVPDEDLTDGAGRSQRIQARLFKQIHRTDLAGDALRLGVEGFGKVLAAFLRPLLESQTKG